MRKAMDVQIVSCPRPDDDAYGVSLGHPYERETTLESDFVECETCRAKPGMPVLCDGCLRNRQLITLLKRKIKKLKRKRK